MSPARIESSEGRASSRISRTPQSFLSTNRPHTETVLIQASKPNASHWTSHRLKISTFSRMPSARAQSNLVTIYSSPSSDSASTLYSPRLYKHPISLGRPLNPGTLRRIAATCRFAPSLRLVQTATCVPNTAEPCPILVHTKSALCGSAPHGACDCPRRLSYKLSSRCIALPKLYATYARRARDPNKACVDIAQPLRKV